MRRFHQVLAVTGALLGAAACGDNSRQCGTGTADVDGVCVGGEGTASCGDGTILDPGTNTCVIDPAACQDGTVLVGDKCVDTGIVTADIEEGAEPNGLGLLGEDSDAEAGDVVIKPVGENFVIHGTIAPFQDADSDGQQDADVDTYIIDVTGPTMIKVSADGLHGLTGGFVSVAAVDGGDPLAGWQRLGLTLSGDTAKRQLYLPAAGTYALAITDSRTILLGGNAVAPGADGLLLDYYVSITAETATPTPITVTDGTGSTSGTLTSGEVKLFTAAMGEGFDSVIYDSPATQFEGSLVVANVRGSANTIKGVNDQGDPDPFASVVSLGFKTGDTTTIVADHVFDLANDPVDFTIDVKASPNAPLSTTGGDAVAANEPDLNSFTGFFYDVTAANEIDGFNISFDKEVGALIFDENFNLFSIMSGLEPMTLYQGHLRHPAPGRYYWAVFDSNDSSGTDDITATSTITTVTPVAITEGTATGVTNVSTAFKSNLFTYTPGTTDPWQQFHSDRVGGGTVSFRHFDPATAFGKLDDLTTTGGFCDAVNPDQSGDCDDTFPFAFSDHAANATKIGRIIFDDPANWLVVINKSNDAGSFNATVEVRDNTTNLGAKNAGDAITDQTGSVSNTAIQRYIVKTQRDNEVNMVVTPTGTVSLLNASIQQVDFDEAPFGPLVNGTGIGQAETGQFYQVARGWTAWTVQNTLVTTGTYSQHVTILPAAYTVATTATAFADACTGGITQTTTDDDDGLTANISAPTGFQLFGTAAATFKVSTNGLINFDTSQTSSFSGHADLPDTNLPNGIIAPFWSDLDHVVICTKVAGTKLIVQWTGTRFDFNFNDAGDAVQFQAILDGSDNTVEYVYGPNHSVGGAPNADFTQEGATVGVENQAGTKAKVIGFDQNVVSANSSQKLTPSP